MKTISVLNRRQLLKQTATVALGIAALPAAFAALAADKKLPWKICAFTKPLQFLSFDELADFFSEVIGRAGTNVELLIAGTEF